MYAIMNTSHKSPPDTLARLLSILYLVLKKAAPTRKPKRSTKRIGCSRGRGHGQP